MWKIFQIVVFVAVAGKLKSDGAAGFAPAVIGFFAAALATGVLSYFLDLLKRLRAVRPNRVDIESRRQGPIADRPRYFRRRRPVL
jgi:hypothetical protein